MSNAAPERDLADFKTKILFGFGSVAGGVKEAGIIGLLLLFYSQVVGLPAHLVSLAIAIAMVCDAVFDPVIGAISDNWRSRWGRRHPFMYAAIIPIGISYALLWNPPHWSNQGLFFYLLVMLIVARLSMSTYEIPSSSLVPEFTTDYHKRTDIVSYRFFFGFFGAIIITLLAFLVFLVPDAKHRVGQLNPAGYPHYGMAAAALIAFSMLVAALATHRHIKHLVVPPKRRPPPLVLLKEMASTLGNKPFVVLLVCGVFASLAAGLGNAMGTIYLTFLWKLNNVQVSYFAYNTAISAFLGLFVAVPLLKRFGKKEGSIALMIGGMLIGALQFVPTLFFGWNPDPNAEHWLIPVMMVVFLIAATGAFAVLVLTGSMLNDLVEAHAVRTGRRQEGVFQSAASLFTKVTSAGGVALSGVLLDMVHFPSHADPRMLDPAIMHHLLFVYMPSLLVLHVIAILALSRYRLTRQQHEENVRRLAEEAARASVLLPMENATPGAAVPAERMPMADLKKPAAVAGE